MFNSQSMLLIELSLAVVLIWFLLRMHASGLLTALNDKRRASSSFVGRGELIDGNRHIPVALAISKSAFFYENADMQATIALDLVREVEYDDELSTGTVVERGEILRIRSINQMLEFVILGDQIPRWKTVLPPHH